MLTILAILLLIAVSYYGWGRLAWRLIGNAKTHSDSVTLFLWLGWACSLLVLQIVHLFVPITAYISIPFFLIGIAACIPYSLSYLRRLSENTLSDKSEKHFWKRAGILLSILALWVAARAMLTPEHPDSGLYHFNSVRWITSFAQVPGLGNLHGRLAFNQSFFTYVAALDFQPLWGQGRAVANSFLLLLVFATLIETLRPVLQKPALLGKSHPFRYGASLLVLPYLVYLTITSNGIASPAPDLTCSLLQIVLFVLLASGLGEWRDGEKNQTQKASVAMILAATMITIKLSNAVFAALIIAFCIGSLWQHSASRLRDISRLVVLNTLLILVWGYRGYLLSGAPLFPSTAGYVAADWAMPKSEVVEEAYWIYSWAKQVDVHWSVVLGNWNWLHPWSRNIVKEFTIIVPLGLFLIFSAAALLRLIIATRQEHRPFLVLEWSLLLPPFLSLAGWFFTAPDPRYAHALFWLLAMSAALVLLSVFQPFLSKRSYAKTLVAIAVFTNAYFILALVRHPYMLKNISVSGWYPLPSATLIAKQTASGLTVYVPVKGDQCWDAPLPCTQYFSSDIRLRVPGKLESGFAPRKHMESYFTPEPTEE